MPTPAKPKKRLLTATISTGETFTRTTARAYTHFIYCPAYEYDTRTAKGMATSRPQSAWSSSAALAQKAADKMGMAWDHNTLPSGHGAGPYKRVVTAEIVTNIH